MPENADGGVLRLYYSFNDTDLQDLCDTSSLDYTDFKNGFASALAINPIISDTTNATFQTLYMAIQIIDPSTDLILPVTDENSGELWNYRIGVSQNDLVFQWDKRSWLQTVDVDHNSALLSIGSSTIASSLKQNMTSVSQLEIYDVYIYTTEEADKVSSIYNSSICAITSGDYLVTSSDYPEIFLNNLSLELNDLAA